ncbi:Obscurin [Orchesella cincta]|uniref:Obscurin n=1 Tax=Orchesella cincta TaxID=48709 RepID=A0A1D2MKK1_ORCCI|nr:Obscurin [Orchesella cincta]
MCRMILYHFCSLLCCDLCSDHKSLKYLPISASTLVALVNCLPNVLSFKIPPISRISETSDRVELRYSTNLFKEIGHNVLQFIGDDLSEVIISCQSTKNETAFVGWKYHGIEERNVKRLKSYDDENGIVIDLSSGPPVVRMECYALKNKSIINNTLIYTGANKAPYLYKNSQTIRATAIYKESAHLPCVLKYPLDRHSDGKQLQLFKDGKLVEKESLSYTPDIGYHINLTRLENPIGTYECRVRNSSVDDVLFVELNYDAFISVSYKGYSDYFYAGAPQLRRFNCKLPKDIFEDKFKWSYLWKNGSYTDAEGVINSSSDSLYYSQTINVMFPDVNIIRLVCSGTIKNSSSTYNNSHPIYLKRSYSPKILNQTVDEPIIYKAGLNLTCATTSEPVSFTWLKNGQPLMNGEYIKEYFVRPPFKTTLVLKPTEEDTESSYTCIVSNFMGEVRHTFRIRRPTGPNSSVAI